MANHKHYDLIVEWAKGEQIQFLNHSNDWIDTAHPSWDTYSTYRVKPNTDVGYMPIYSKWQNDLFYQTISAAKQEEFDQPIAIIKLTLENGIPVSVELIKE